MDRQWNDCKSQLDIRKFRRIFSMTIRPMKYPFSELLCMINISKSFPNGLIKKPAIKLFSTH